jgi:hypothetical protein
MRERGDFGYAKFRGIGRYLGSYLQANYEHEFILPGINHSPSAAVQPQNLRLSSLNSSYRRTEVEGVS